eukprot:jgi/Tetstr1/464068/TSEL_008873.t1
MPLFTIPSLSADTYHDGAAVTPGDVAVPILVVVDGNNKTTFVRGDPVTILDTEAPVVSGFAVAQDGSGYTFAPSAGTVRDYTRAAVNVYHVIALAGEGNLTAAEILALVEAPANAGQFGSATIGSNTPGDEVALAGLSLGTDKVYDSGSFRDIAEGDTVRNYLLAVNPSANADNEGALAASAALSTGTVADRTPPAGLGSVTLGAPTNDQIPVQNLDAITDGGDGVSSISVHYNTSDDFGGATEVAGVSPPAYNLSGLDGVTEYHVWVTATDGTNAAAEVKVGTATTLDGVDPVISSFDASQGAGYAFSADAGTLSDNADGPLKAYLVMAATQQTTADLKTLLVTNSNKDTMEAGAKDEAFAYTAPAAASVSSLGLSTSQYWTGSAWAAISEAAPAAPHQLWAHLYVEDAAGNDGSAVNAGSIKTVADSTAPAFGGAVALSSPASDSITVAWDAAVTDGRGVSGAAVYYSQNDPAAAGSIAAWKADGGTSSAAVDASASGSETVTGLSAGTTYYAYLSASDAAGNALDVATTPASVETEAASSGGDGTSVVTQALTSASSGGYTVTRSSAYSSNYEGWQAFDRTNGTGHGSSGGTSGGWASANGSSPPHWVAIQLPAPATVASIRLWNTEAWAARLITGCEIQGSGDGSSWTTLQTFTGMTYATVPDADKATNEFFQADFDTDKKSGEYALLFQGDLGTTGAYTHYRIYVTAQDSPEFASMSELVLLTASYVPAEHEPDFAAALQPYSTDLGDDVVTASGSGDDSRAYLDADPFPVSGQSMTFVSVARYSEAPATGTAWYLYRDGGSANRPRVTFTQSSFDIAGGSTNASSTPTFPAGFFTNKFLFAFTFDAATKAVNAYLVGKPGGTLTAYSLSAVTNAPNLTFDEPNLFWAPDSPGVAYMRKFKFWTRVLSQAEVEAVAAAEL